MVKFFYDWFVKKRYLKTHPIINFNFESYKKELLKHEKLTVKRSIRDVPESFEELFKKFISYVNTLGYSSKYTIHYERGLQIFFYYLESINSNDIKQVTEDILISYSVYLKEWRDETGKGYSNNTRGRYLGYMKRFFLYLLRIKYLEKNPSVFIDLPKCQKGLPTTGLTDSEVKKLLSSVNTLTLKGKRDMALLLTFYSTGARSNEVRHLKMNDIDYVRGLVRFNETKGGKNFQRIVAIGKTALGWIQIYLKEVRKHLLKEEDQGYIFLSMLGNHIGIAAILQIVKNYMIKSRLQKNIVTHSFRVSCGTEMLRGGADLKYIQQQLGHICINSTERYMRLVPGDLKKIHSKTHPEERRHREIAVKK